MDSLEKLVADHPFLRGMSASHLQSIAECAMRVTFEEGEFIFKEGDPANRFYLILNGCVRLESSTNGKSPVAIETVGRGDVVGWSWLFPPFIWHFDARTLEKTDAVFLYGSRLRERCEEDTSLGYELMKRMAEVVIKRLQATRQLWILQK